MNILNLSHGQKEMLSRVESAFKTVQAYEDFDLQQKALDLIPVDRLHDEARKAVDEQSSESLVRDDFYDALMKRLLKWFKLEFFKWVNSPECDFCKSETTGVGTAEPKPEELFSGAGRIEIYKCRSCDKITRFPRYNRVEKLLETRRGRCGEWANCFTLICRAMGFQARYVLDFTDHVWTEYYSSTRKRWVHLDSCEEAYDNPYVYEVGWGKRLTYVFSFSPYYCVDTVNRYTRQLRQVMERRNLCSELWLCKLLQSIRSQRLSLLSREAQEEIKKNYIEELGELLFSEMRSVSQAECITRISGA